MRLLTKKALCNAFGLVSKSGHCYYGTLRKSYFSDQALKEIGISKERYMGIKGMSTFTYDESVRIIAYFKILPDEL